MKKLFREPLLHFILIGGLLFIVFNIVHNSNDNSKEIIIDQSDLERMVNTWELQWKRKPTAKELTNLLKTDVKQEVLYLEALEMNLDHNDEIIKRRLSQKMEFLSKDLASITEPTDKDLIDYFEANSEKYLTPYIYSFYQVLFTQDKSGADYKEKAQSVLKNNATASLTEMKLKSDSFIFSNEFTNTSGTGLSREFGSDFSKGLQQLPDNTWTGPVKSGFGVHLVFITKRQIPKIPDFNSVREDVFRNYMYDKEILVNQTIYDALKKNYQIVIDIEPTKEVTKDFINELREELNNSSSSK